MIFVFLISLFVIANGAEVSKEFASRNKVFGLDLQLNLDSTKNVVCSGFSLQTILSLTSVGAKGETEAELKRVVKLPSSNEEIKKQAKDVQSVIGEEKRVVITSANQIYLAKSFQIEPEFLSTAKEYFNSGVQNVNFNESQKAAEEINTWVEKQTHNKIKNLIREDQLSGLTRMVLVNALYFKGIWQHPFDLDDTEKQSFHLTKDQKIDVDTMKITATFDVYKSEDCKATFVRIPFYSKNKAHLTVVIPNEIDGADDVLKKLSPHSDNVKYSREYMTLYLPKFRVESTLDVKAILKEMGVQHLFSSPDLSGITKEAVVVDAITQKVFIDVNEVGTEAAAATAEMANSRILLTGKAIPAVYRVDRPFLFGLVYDEVLLLNGKVVNPAQH